MTTLVSKAPLNADALIALVYAVLFVLGVGAIIAAEDWIAAMGLTGTPALIAHGGFGLALLSVLVAVIATVSRATESEA
ncbi:hypothetical protein V8J36_00295 [Frigidibacter sp. MR17.14]|uniref:hypothetical protein n=1 Tax=Frigidibacter sp. MR17.14 TaxID=3126509 RepID=UPI003012F72F